MTIDEASADLRLPGFGLYTVGHGTLEAAELAELLRASDIRKLVDVRRFPASRRNPRFARSRVERWLPEYGIDYRWEHDLGGFRRPEANSPNRGLRNLSFRGYADYMTTEVFRRAFDRLLAEARVSRTAIMCSEAVWWRCHRRLIADASELIVGIQVAHLAHDGRVRPHIITEGARAADLTVTYPGDDAVGRVAG